MSENTCNVCGANLIYKDGRWVCPACGAYKEEEISNEEVTLLYNASQKLRLASFDDAEELYADIVKKYPKNSEAHWGLVLSRYGIKYEDDYDGRKLPTCYAATMESFLSDKEYLAALSCAPDAKVKAYYEEQGKIIEKNRIEWYEKASKEPAYDVFLCFKDSDKENNIERTDDSIEVANLYTYLSGKGYRVFFSRETLRDKVAEKYEPYIYNALNTASVMIVYGSKPEYFESVWMKNEWTRFLKRMREGLKVDGSLIVAYDGMNPAELPKVFAGRQCLDARKKTFYGDLETLIARVIAIAKRPKAAVERIEIKGAVGRKKTSVGTQIKTIQAGGAIGKKAPIAVNTGVATREIGQYEVPELTPDEETKTKTVFRFLSAGLFDNAKKAVEEILKNNHYNSRALFAKLLVHYEAKNETELAGNLSAVDDFEEIKTVIAYNDKSIGEKIISALSKQVLSFMESGEYSEAIRYLREIGPYNSSAVTELKANLKPYTVSLLAEHPDTSEQLFAALLETYTDADTYIPYLQDYVNQCLQNNRLELAKKYNDKVVELDDGDLNATLISMYLSVSANCLADFIEKADAFTEFAMLDSALRKFDADEVDGFFVTMEKIISGLIGRQANGDAICRWFDFVTKYEFAERQDLIRTTMASLAELSDCKKRSKLFNSILACIDSADVDRHISMRMEFAASLQSEGAFSLADKYYAQVLDIEEGNCDAMFGRILCGCGAESEWNLSEAVDKLEDFNAFEALLRYCPDEDTRCKYLNTVLSAINERSKSVTDKATIARLSGVFDGIVKYYPEDRNKELLSYTMHFAANAKNSAAFETAEKYYAVALSIDHLCHEAYWGLLQAKLSCRNNDDLIHQKTPISNMPEFSSAIAAAGDDDRSADRYVKLAKDQRDYLKEQRDKCIRRKKIKKRVTITATLLVFALLISGAIVAGVKYYQSESILKYDPNESGYSIVAGKFYKSATVELPHTVNEKPLTVISAGAFKNNKTVETVIIPSSVTTIEAEAFSGCTNLKTIVFKSKTRSEIITLSVSPMSGSIKTESGVISIGDRAFYGCENLSAMDLSSIRSIGENAFDGCKALAELTLSDQLTTVKAGAFSGCASLKTVYLPATVEYLGRAAFSGCVGLKSVVFEERDGGIGTFDIAWREGMSDKTRVDIGFKLTLDYGKSTGNIGAKTVAVIRDGNFAMPVPVRAGYTFVGWFTAVTDGEQLTDAEGKSLKKYDKDEAIILYAVFEANANKVSFDANGGIGSMPKQTIHTDEIAKLVSNTFAKAGYTFVGWATAPDGKKVYNDTQSVEMGMESFTLYAVWEAKINTIHFDANGGSGEAFSQDIATDETRVLTKNTYTKNGYTFIGWATTPSGAIAYADQESYTMGTDASYTLYAVWKLVDYSVSYELNGGVDDRNPTIYNFLSDSFTLHNPMRPGYTFLGWSGTGIDGLSLSVTIATGSVGNRSYTANWKANENTLHFDANGGNGGSMSDMKIASDAKAALLKNGFTRSGYEFAGWAESANGSKVYSDEETYSMGLESSYTLYALWKPKTYSITYKLNGGQTSESNKTTYDIESDSFSLVNPVREGYIFVGWSGSGLDSNENLSVSVSTGTYGDLTFTANWKAIEYQITYDLDGGQNNSGNPGTYTIEQLITLLPPTKTGYTFKGWSDGGVIAKGSTGEKTFTAIWEISGYKINYNLNGGINHPSNPDEYNVDNDTITLKEPTRLGYRFIGWSDGGVIEHGSTGAKTFTASWEVITYKIIYILDGGVNAPGNSETYTVEDVITLIPPTKVGYRFDGWSNGGLIEKGSTGDKEFTATWSIIDYKISYELNGGTNHAKNPESYTVNSADITLNEPTRPGYRFVGWSDGGTIPHGSTGDKTFVAQWEANSNTIKYDPNGGNGTMSDSIMHTDESAKLSQNTYARTGYVFAGWATEQGGVVQYKDESLYTMGAESEVILYAVWTPVTYRISYDLAGGNETSNPGEYNIETDDITLIIPTRPGYTFTGWSGTGIDGKQKLVTISKGSIGERQYTANWEANRNTIVFHPNGGTGTMENQTIPTDESQALTRNGFTKAGYTFVGWAISSDTAVKHQDGASYTMGVEETYHLYAIWTPNQNTLTFDGNGATSGSMDALRKYSDEKFTLPGVGYTKTGYSFKGWSKTPNGTVLVQDGADYTMDCQDQVILYAVWGINQYTITIEANGGKGTTKITQDYNTVVKAPTLTRSGYAFEEWFADADFKTVYNFATMPADNITVYVKWQLNNFGGEQTGIRTPAELDAIRNNLAGNYYLENSIDMDGVDWLPIGNSTEPFTGFFDGKGNVIKNLKITKSNNYYVGLFGYSNSTIRNVHVKNAYYRTSTYTGGITGYGNVADSSWSGEINSGNLTDSDRMHTCYTGGITGCGLATNCATHGLIEVILCTYDTTVTPQVGGIIGFAAEGGSISGCYSNVDIRVDYKLVPGGHSGHAAGITPSIGCKQKVQIINCYVEGTIIEIRNTTSWSASYDRKYGDYSATSYSLPLIHNYGSADITYSYDSNNFYVSNSKISLTKSEYQSRTYMLNQGWDEAIWCFGYGKPVFYGDGYIRVVYSNVEGANNDSNPSGFKVGSDGFILKIPYRAGYTFEGWYTDAAFTNKITEVKGLTTTLTIYAKWTANTYTITLNPVGGELTETTASVRYDSDYRLPVPTLPGYTFAGWYDGTGSTAMAITDADGNSLVPWSFATTVTLYAKWNANRNTIVFHPNGGTGTMENQTIPTDESQALTRNGFSKVGYTFAGWAISSDTAVKYQDGASYTMGVEETYHLYAIWTPNQNTLTFDGNGATSGSMDSLRKYSDEKFTLPRVGYTKTGYSFKGWSKTPNGTVLVQDGAGYTMDCQDQVILYAVWEARQYTITLNSNGGTINGSKQIRVTFDTTYQLSIPTPGKLGYQFAGWYNGTTNEFIAFTDETGKSLVPWNQPSDITLYAVWNVKDEMKNFQFISDAQNCEISGIYDKSVTEIIVPAYVTKIAFGAFEGCNSVEKITLPFVGDCESTDESHPKTFGYIFGGFLADSDNLYSYVMSNQDNQVFQNGYHENNTDRLVFYIPSSIRHVVITKQQIVPAYAFEGCDLIESISISNTTTTISTYAFWQCKNLKFFIIPNSVTLIESAAFTECISLERINSSETGLAIIPEGVQRIGTYAFNGLSCITKFELPLSLTMIEGRAFANCIKLEELYIPNNVSSIGDGIVTGCIALSSLEVSSSNSTFYSEGNCIIRDTTLLAACKSSIVPNDRGITRIGALAFSGYEGTLVLPGTITFIDERAFRNCNISCIKYEGTIQAWKQKVLKNKYWDEGLNNYVVQCEDGTIENP